MGDVRRIEYQDIGSLVGALKNPKRHAEEHLDASFNRFGFTEPLVLDERTGRLVAGHGRLAALLRLREKHGQPPEGVDVSAAGEWTVPVVRGWSSRNDKEADAYVVASNQITIAGGWDDGELVELLRGLEGQLSGVGFSEEELSKLIDSAVGPSGRHGLTDVDDAPELPEKKSTWVQPGDLFELEGHRILCGDSTKGEDIDRLMGKDKARVCWTDPPWNIALDGEVSRGRKSKGTREIANDNLGEDFPQFCALFAAEMRRVLVPGAPLYLVMADDWMATMWEALQRLEFHWSSMIIWVKDQMNVGRRDYHAQHETIWYGWQGDAPRLVRLEDRTQSDVWSIPRPKRADDHPTMKPVELVVRSLKNSSRHNDICFEPFSGSGTTLMACEATGRRCRALELDPRYVQVAVERWQNWTGRKAKKV
jgi:DNA modification methylase